MPAEKHAWRALALGLAVIATLVVMLVDATRKVRRETTKRDGDSTGSN